MAKEIVWSDRKRIIFGLPWTFTKYILTKEKLLVEEKEQGRFARMRKLNALRLELKKAVRREDFEQAAKLRDEIRALEQEHKESA